MRKLYFLLSFFCVSLVSQAQLSGVKNIPGDYATLAAAITDLNTQGVDAGGVTFNVGANQTITAPYVITATGTAANPIVFMGNGNTVNATGGAGTTDAIFVLSGSDYVTIDNFILTGDATVEWGIALLKKNNAVPFDGCQNNVVSGNTISLAKSNVNSIGIYANHHIATSTTTLSTTGTVADDANSNNLVSSNTISNVYIGILFNGINSSTVYDAANSFSNNSISNYGGGSATTYGVRAIYFNNITVDANQVNLPAGTTTTAYGIMFSTGSGTGTISNNIVQVAGGATTSTLYAINNGAGLTTLNMTGNTIQNSTFTTATSGAFYLLYNSATVTTVNITGNTITGNSHSGTGTFYGIYNATATTLTISNNTINGNNRMGASGTLYCMYVGTGVATVSGNQIYNNGAPSTSGTSSSTVYGIYSASSPTVENITNNSVYSLAIAGSTTSTSCAIYGIYTNPISTTTKQITGNTVHTISTHIGTAAGIYTITGNAVDITRNKIYNISTNGAAGVVYGVYISSGTTVTVANNTIGDLKAPASTLTAPAPSVSGIYVVSPTTANIYFNTIYLTGTSSGANFGSAAVYASTTPTVTLRNNILINATTPKGTGKAAAYQRSSATLTTYGSSSDNNLFYAGTPGTANVIFYDGTNSDQTLAAYKTRVAPRDANSISENLAPAFISTAGSNANYLHITAGTSTGAESGGSNIPGITTDFDGDIRAGNTGYTGSGVAPDMGADEFNGVTASPACIAPATQATALTFGTATATTQAGTFTLASGTPTGYLIVASAGALNGTPVNGTGYTTGNTIGTNGTVVAATATGTFSATALTANTSYTYTIFTYNASGCIGGPVYNTTAPLTGTATTCPAAPTAVTTSNLTQTSIQFGWTAPAGGTAASLTYTVEVATDNTFATIVGTQTSATTSATVTGLTAATVYYYRVRANNGICSSVNSTTGSVATVCANFPLPVVQGFNATTIPICWSTAIAAVQTASKITFVTSGSNPTTSPSEGTHFVQYNSFSSTSGAAGSEERLISPKLTTTGISSVDVEFFWRNENSTSYNTGAYLNEGVQVQYSTDNGTTWVNAGPLFARYDASLASGVAQWNKKTVTLPAAAGNQAGLLVAFKFHSEYGDNMFLDAVTIKETPSCTAPTGSSVSSITSNSASVAFTFTTGTNFIIEYGPAGFTPGTGASAGTGGTIITSATSPVALSGLSSSTTYSVYVRQNCGAGLLSANTPVVSFTTLCVPPTIASSTPASRCGIGAVTLQATATPAGSTITWYSAATGSAALATGTSFTTPTLSATTTYYAEPSQAITSFNIGQATDAAANLSSLGAYGMYFSTVNGAVINTVDIYPSTAGTLNVSLKNASGTTVDTRSFTIVAGDISTTVKKTLALGFNIPAGSSGWQIYYDLAIYRGGVGTYTYPVSANSFAITGNTLDGNNITSGTRYYFYNWNVTTTCVGTRTAVTATVATPPSIAASASAAIICAGQSATLNVTSANAGYTYSWTPGNLAGATQTVSPTALTKYIVTATDNSGGANAGCVTRDSVSIAVAALPPAVTINASANPVCPGTVTALSINGGSASGNAILGTGTTTNTATTYPSPLSNYFGGTKHQMLILASELQAAGMFVGNSINSIRFDVAAVGASFSGTLNNFQVDMGLTSSTALTSTSFLGGLSNVRAAANLPVAVGTVSIPLQTPFVWDGVSNLVIQTSYSNANTGSTNTTVQMKNSATAFTSTNWYRADGATAAAVLAATTPTSSSATRPNIVLAFDNTNTYTWSPATDLYTDTAATIPYTGGATTGTIYAKPSAAAAYTVTASTTAGCTNTGSIALTLYTPTAITTQPTAAQLLCQGATATFSVGATGSNLTYQWKRNDTAINAATSAIYTIPSVALSDSGIYTVVVTGACGVVTSSTAVLTVGARPQASFTVPATACTGVPVTFTNMSTVAAGTIASTSWDFGDGSTATTFNGVHTYTTPGTYAIKLTGASSSGCTGDSVTMVVNVMPATVITSPLTNQTICAGTNITFAANATGSGLSYEWRKNGVTIPGATSDTLAITGATAADAGTYRVVVSGTCNVDSSSATLTVNAITAIGTQPASQTVCPNTPATFSITATGTSLTYQWSKDGVAIANATNPTLNIASATTSDAGSYTVVVTGACGSMTSAAAVLTVSSSTVITTQPVAAQTVCAGAPVSFTVAANGAGTLTYQWRKDGNPITGATLATYSIASATAADAATYSVVVTGSCGAPVISSNAILTVNPVTVITTQPAATQTVCAGTGATFMVAATGSGLTYQWKKNGTDISGAINATYTIGATATTDAATYTVTVTGACGTVTSTDAVLTVNTVTAITTPPATAQTVCAGSPVSFTVTASGTALSYQWKKNGTNIVGANAATYTISSVTAADAATYTVVVTGSCGTVTSGNAQLNVNATTVIGTQPVAQVSCPGTSVTFAVAATGASLSYQWKKNGTDIAGAISASYLIGSLTAADAATYTVVVTGSCGTLTSAGALLTVNTTTAITSQPAATQTVCAGAPVSFTVAANGTGLSYQWKKNGTDIANATSASYTIAAATSADAATYTVVVTGACGTSTSSASVLAVNAVTVITTQPTAQVACPGTSVTFSVAATGSGTLTYQWKKNGTDITGANTASYTIASAAAADAATYSVVVSGSCGTVTSANAVLTVNTTTVITSQPAATQTVCPGSNATFTVAANGTALSYQWKKNGANITGATSATYTINSVSAADAATYTVTVTGTCGTVASGNAVLAVNTTTVISTQPAAQAVCAGAGASFSVAATGTGITYQWKKNGTDITGATGATYSIAAVTAADAGAYTVVVTGACGTVTSATANLTLNAPASISAQPLATSVCVGTPATFSVTPGGVGPFTYQWKKDGVTIAGATSATYTVASATAADAASYTVVVTGACGTVTSAAAPLTVTTCITAANSSLGEASVRPSLAGDQTTIVVASLRVASIKWQLVDAKGNIVKVVTQNVVVGLNSYRLDLTGKAAGVYYLRGFSPNETIPVLKLVKR